MTAMLSLRKTRKPSRQLPFATCLSAGPVLLCASVLGILLASGCASEQIRQERLALAQAQAAMGDDPAQQISCRRMSVTGRTLTQKVCRSQQEWAVFDGETSGEEMLRSVRENSALIQSTTSTTGTAENAMQMGL